VIVRSISRLFVTLVVVACAAAAGYLAWRRYVESPWTRDGRVRADVIAVAPEVSGVVTSVPVEDNQQVHKGDVLLVIDPTPYRFALAQAEANLEGRENERAQRQRELARRQRLTSNAIAAEALEQAAAALATAEAAYGQALAELNMARLNLDRTQVRSPVNGYVTNLVVHPGDYANAGRPMLAIVDSDSFYVIGYFEETKLRAIHDNDRASVRLIAFADPVDGHVEGIARAIADRDAPPSEIVANPNPTFAWVRLAQRIPVRIAIDRVPDSVRLSAGMTATIVVEPQAAPAVGENR
jgi:multidrug resistance efflux pump